MTPKEAQIHIRYSTWASTRLLDAAMKLPPEDAKKDLGCSHKGVLDTLNHVHMADRAWLYRVLGDTMEQPVEALEVEWPKIQQRWQEWVDALKDEDLTRAIAYKDLKGNFHVSPVWQIVLHVVNHGTLHRGQVMAMFRQLGQAPPPTDLMFYYRELKIA